MSLLRKWALVGRASLKQLREADAAATQKTKSPVTGQREDWERDIEDSKYL